MSTEDVMGADRLRWWQYVGPWPLRPIVAGFLMSMMAAAYAVGFASASGTPVRVEIIRSIVIGAAIPALGLAAYFEVFRRFVPIVRRNVWVYLAVTFSGAVLVIFLRILVDAVQVSDATPMRFGVAAVILRNFILIAFLQSAIGIASWRIASQARRAEAALSIAREQQELLLNADERTRRQVSSLLHDRVQAGLIAACLELQEIAQSQEDSDVISDVIDRLEHLRALDVRRAARTLSPDLVDTDLQAALEELGAQYAPGMRVLVRVDANLLRADAHADAHVLLGAYRIIEQAILNSAVHGRASECDVNVKISSAHLVVEVRDNGIGLGVGLQHPGLGSTLMTTWARMLDGQWSRSPLPDGGVLLAASLPLS